MIAPETEEILRKKESEEIYDLVEKLRISFCADKIVPVDTLILEKIVIHNLNQQNPGYYYRQKDRNWPYALPEEIYFQILKHDVDSPETEILFEILREQISILSVKSIGWEQRKYLTRDELDYYWPRWHIIRTTETIQSRMIQVVNKLKSDEQYEKYLHQIPDIEMSKDYTSQIWYDLGL